MMGIRRMTMRLTITGAVLAAAPAFAQDDAMTCGDFLALDDAAKVEAMLELRAAYSGETISPEEEAEDATVLTGATEAGAKTEDPAAVTPNVLGSPEAVARMHGMRTACMGVPDVPAIDALVAAHADYEPVLDGEAGN